jgi:pimeloyl-ACP methyl ester carboxylesterase
MADFERDLENTNAGIALDLESPSDVMLIAFSGLIGRLGTVPLFEFFNTASRFGAKKAFLRDLTQSWYHHGVAGVGDDIPAVADYLSGVIRRNGITRTVLVGNSGGGYAALLFGQLLNADEVHAFRPTTYIDPKLRADNNDGRYQEFLDRMLAGRGIDSRYVDLVPVLEREGKTEFHVYYQTPDALDSLHAVRLGEIDRVVLHPVDFGEYRLIRRLRETGELTRILERALEPQSA